MTRIILMNVLFVLSFCVFSMVHVEAQVVDLFPTPITSDASLFSGVDDSYLEVGFTGGFTFDFYGSTYSSVFLNTNGGLTFGAGDGEYDLQSVDISEPGIAVFWGDMGAFAYGAEERANQMTYEQLSDRFVVTYTKFQDLDEDWNNTATLTLFDDGTTVIDYGDVQSEDILIGIFDGTHVDDRHDLGIRSIYYDYGSLGSGIILNEYGHGDEAYEGALNFTTVTFTTSPIPEPSSLTLLGIGLAGLVLRRRRQIAA